MDRLIVLLAGLLIAAPAARADSAAAGAAIAAALNERDPEAMLRTIDLDALVRLVVKDFGLNAADREAVGRGLPQAVRNGLSITMRTLEGSEGSVKFLRGGARDARPFALLRYDLGDQGIDYVEYYLTPADKVEDWYIHTLATRYTASMRFDLATMLKMDSMLFALFGTRLTTQADLKPFSELRGHLAAQNFAAAYRTLEQFPEGYRRSRQWALMRVSFGGRIDEATHRGALRYLAGNFGTDPELQFMLIDHYFFEQQFDRALGAVSALERTIGGEDAATASLRGNLLIAVKRFGDAAHACRRGMALEPDHKPAYWCLVAVGLNAKNGKIAVEGLTAYERAFAVEFDPAKLGAQDEYREISRTPEFSAWARSRRR